MLKSIDIKNIAVIESLSLDFKSGMTVLTGETGAGKSIIIDSINLILGSRSDKGLVRHGTEKAHVNALFDAPPKVRKKLEELDIDVDDELVISRTLSQDGKSTARINGFLVNQTTLRDIASELITIHGQQDNYAILNDAKHIEFLDSFADTHLLLSEYTEKFTELKEIKSKLDSLNSDEEDKLRLIDMLKYQTDEIEKAELKIGEKEELVNELTIIRNSAKIASSVNLAYSVLYENDSQTAYDAVSQSCNALESVSEFDPSLSDLYSRLVDIKYSIEDIVHELRAAEYEFDENRLNEIEERLDTIEKLEKKYGGSIENVLAFYDEASIKLENLSNSDIYTEKLQKEYDEKKTILSELAEKLHIKRVKYAKILGDTIENELSELDMEKSKFTVSIEKKEGFSKNGIDDVKFMISTNPGEPLKPLTKIASGGELSRTMLAVKTVLSKSLKDETMIFDEIDTGVSGNAAQKIAAKLWTLAKNDQVICISHQPQLAAFADNHYYIEKNISENIAKTSVRELTKEEHEKEVARITDGLNITQTAIAHAREMIKNASEKKKVL